MRLLRSERGGILALSAVIIPVFLLLTALILDAGRWYTYKRALQNRADAGALAAGFEYLSQLPRCASSPGSAATAIENAARLYAGAAPGDYNVTVNKQADVSVTVNADGVGPCDPHDPDGRIWTDVRVKERNIGTVAGTFGVSLPSITADARVELRQAAAVVRGLPFITESGDTIDCVWAEFVRARDGAPFSGVMPASRVRLTRATPGAAWSADIQDLDFASRSDVAIRFYAGSSGDDATCDFAADARRPLPHSISSASQPVAIDWINVYSAGGGRPGPGNAPVLRHFALTGSTCGSPGFVYTPSTDPSIECRLGFSAEIDTGQNNVRGEITVEPIQTIPPAGGGIASVTEDFDTSGGAPNLDTVTGTIVIHPNAATTANGLSQDYTQVGQTFFRVSWRQTTGTVNGQACNPGMPCSGTFQGETVSGVADDIQQATYVADPLGSTPLISTSTTLPTTSFPRFGSTGPFTISVSTTGLDETRVTLVRDTTPDWNAIGCGGTGGLGATVESAISNGCPKVVTLNTRSGSCSPPPTGNAPDCVALDPGIDKTANVRRGLEARFACTPNRWVPGGPLPPAGDRRWVYVPTALFARTAAGGAGWVPVGGFARLYVTGWGGSGFTVPCGLNDPPPRGFDVNGAQLWGHLVDPVTLDATLITGDTPCNTELDVIQCKPTLVR